MEHLNQFLYFISAVLWHVLRLVLNVQYCVREHVFIDVYCLMHCLLVVEVYIVRAGKDYIYVFGDLYV